MRDRIINILCEVNSQIGDNLKANLIGEGVIDSFDIVRIVSSIEEEFKISIDANDIVEENFNTVDSIIALVERIV